MGGLMLSEIEINGYVFSIDIEKTSQYYTRNIQCDCEACQNFCKQIKGLFPDLENFLLRFGIDISRPDDAMWLENDNSVDYSPCYTVAGSIVNTDSHEIRFDDLKVKIHNRYIPNVQTEPYFVIEVCDINLPWVLNAPILFVPKKESCIRQILHRLIKE